MPDFENPGHREALQRLGVLQADETSLSGEILAERTIKSQAYEAVFSILRQEVAQPLTAYQMIDSMLMIAKAAANRIVDEITLAEATRQLEQIATLPVQAAKVSNDLIEFAAIFLNIAPVEQIQNLSVTARDELRRMVQYAEALQSLIKSRRAMLGQEIAEINELITRKQNEINK